MKNCELTTKKLLYLYIYLMVLMVVSSQFSKKYQKISLIFHHLLRNILLLIINT